MNVRTHYENLQVTENASPEVIRGAYRYLSQKWHPDKNPDSKDEAERITQLINEAYAVLSDAQRRKEHDSWIKSQREQTEERTTYGQESINPLPAEMASTTSTAIKPSVLKGASWGAIAGVAAFVFFAIVLAGKPSSQFNFDFGTFVFFVVAGTLLGAWGLRK